MSIIGDHGAEIYQLKKEMKDLKYEMESLKRFIYLDGKELQKLYETYKKISEDKESS